MPHVLDFNDTLPQKSHNKISQLIRKIYLQDKSVNMNSFLNFVEVNKLFYLQQRIGIYILNFRLSVIECF